MFPKSTLLPTAPARGTVSGETTYPLHVTLRTIQNVVASLAGARGGGPDHSPKMEGMVASAMLSLRVPGAGARPLASYILTSNDVK